MRLQGCCQALSGAQKAAKGAEGVAGGGSDWRPPHRPGSGGLKGLPLPPAWESCGRAEPLHRALGVAATYPGRAAGRGWSHRGLFWRSRANCHHPLGCGVPGPQAAFTIGPSGSTDLSGFTFTAGGRSAQHKGAWSLTVLIPGRATQDAQGC